MDNLDQIFPTRREIIAQQGGIAPHLEIGFVPSILVLNATEAQLNALTPNWKQEAGKIKDRGQTSREW